MLTPPPSPPSPEIVTPMVSHLLRRRDKNSPPHLYTAIINIHFVHWELELRLNIITNKNLVLVGTRSTPKIQKSPTTWEGDIPSPTPWFPIHNHFKRAVFSSSTPPPMCNKNALPKNLVILPPNPKNSPLWEIFVHNHFKRVVFSSPKHPPPPPQCVTKMHCPNIFDFQARIQNSGQDTKFGQKILAPQTEMVLYAIKH